MENIIKDEAVLSNEFIRFSNALKPLTEFEIDVFLYMCAKAKENYKEKGEEGWEEELEINMIEFFEKSGKKTKWLHYTEEERKEYIKLISGMRHKGFNIFLDKYKRIIDGCNFNCDFEEYIGFDYLTTPHYIKHKNTFTAKMPSETRKFLCKDDEEFTPIKFKNLFKLKSKTSKLMYIYFRSYIENKGSKIKGFSIEIDKFKKHIGMEGKYSSLYDFKRYVLIPAIREINNNTDIFIIGQKEKMEEELQGRNFKDLTENEQLDVIIKSICNTGKKGKAIKQIEIHVLDKNYHVYQDYYAPDEETKKAS